MRLSGFAIGALLHSQSTHNSFVDAFSIPRIRSHTTATKNAPHGNDLSIRSLAKLRANTPVVLNSSGGVPEDFDSYEEVYQHPEDGKFKDLSHGEITENESADVYA